MRHFLVRRDKGGVPDRLRKQRNWLDRGEDIIEQLSQVRTSRTPCGTEVHGEVLRNGVHRAGTDNYRGAAGIARRAMLKHSRKPRMPSPPPRASPRSLPLKEGIVKGE